MVVERAAPLVAKHVTKRYGRVVALSNVSLSIPAGSLTALVGPNAAGKSTLIKTFLGHDDELEVETTSTVGAQAAT